MIASVLATEMWHVLNSGEALDHSSYVRKLAELPDSWYAPAEQD